jgi:SLA1 homology domain 1, SHD1
MKTMLWTVGTVFLAISVSFELNSVAEARTWSDASGKFKVEGELVSFHDGIVVVQTAKAGLLALRIEQLSAADQEYVNGREAKESLELYKKTDIETRWDLVNGISLVGSVTDITVQNVVIHRKDDMVFVGETSQEKLRPIYRQIVVAMVNHFSGKNYTSLKEVEEHLKKLRPPALQFQVESVVISSQEFGAVYVPLFLFDERSKKLLAPSLDRLKAIASSKLDDTERGSLTAHESAMSRALLRANAANRQGDLLTLRMLQLGIQTGSEAVDIWEVLLVPWVAYRWPVTAIIVADNSEMAAALALRQYPGYTVSGVVKAR